MTIAEWLQSVGLSKYAPLFEEHEITVDVLPHLTDADVERLHLPIGSQRRLKVELEKLAAVGRAPEAERAVAASRPGGGAERRQLTVMFCDIVGSTALAERLDPEELRDLLQRYRRTCSEAVERYDGHVAQYLGDGLMVYFGWPTAHEDDPERGVRAALEMMEAVKDIGEVSPLAIRIGLATGPVVVGDTANTEAKLAVGETPNLASRLQGLAGAGEVLIASTTRHLVGDTFELIDLGPQVVKGVPEPIQAFRVDAVHRSGGRFDSRHIGRPLSPLVGREDEAAVLLQRWDQARTGAGQVVLIGGEAGIGKSRLTQVLRERAAKPHRTRRYQCSPYHLNSALHPFIEQFEFVAGFARGDSAEQRLDKMESAIAGGAEQAAEWAPLFAGMLSLPVSRYPPLNLSPQRQKEKLFDALIGQVAALTEDRPMMILVEDLHWIDPTSQELLDALIPRLLSWPVLLVATHRPEYEPRWTLPSGITTMALNRLGRRDGAELIGRVTDGRELPPDLLEEILARTDGVPLFVEELTKSVLESGLLRDTGDRYELQAPLSTLAIPTTLRDSLVARLDRLAPVKEIAQIGACLGREFSYELLARVAGVDGGPLAAALAQLVESGLVVRHGTSAAATYSFKHALVQDAAYDSLLKSRRVQLHASIARVLEQDFAADTASRPESLAHHHTHAGNLSVAIPLWRRAGELALARVALLESVGHFQKALALMVQLPASPDRDRLELTIREPLNAAWVGLRGWAAPEIAVNTTAILGLAREPRNARSLLLGLWWMWTNTVTQGRIADSVPWAEQLLEEGRATGDLDFQIFGNAAAMVPHFFLGELDVARREADRVRELYDLQRADQWIQLTGHDLRTFVDVYACQLLWMQGYPDQAKALSEQSAEQARTVGHLFNLVWALTFSSYVFAYRREPARFRDGVAEADRLAREQGLAFIYQVSVPQAEGVARVQEGRAAEAIPLLRNGIESWANVGGNVRIPFLKSVLAEALALDGDVAGGLRLIDDCIEQITRPGWQEFLWLPEVLRLKGWMLIRANRRAEAETQLRVSIDCAHDQGARSWELRSATTLAQLLSAGGDHVAARNALLPVYEWFTEGFDTPDLIEAREILQFTNLQIDELTN
jgi:class 3 adenylate cyclase